MDRWLVFAKTEKARHPVRPFISNLMVGFDDDDKDNYGEA